MSEKAPVSQGTVRRGTIQRHNNDKRMVLPPGLPSLYSGTLLALARGCALVAYPSGGTINTDRIASPTLKVWAGGDVCGRDQAANRRRAVAPQRRRA